MPALTESLWTKSDVRTGSSKVINYYRQMPVGKGHHSSCKTLNINRCQVPVDESGSCNNEKSDDDDNDDNNNNNDDDDDDKNNDNNNKIK